MDQTEAHVIKWIINAVATFSSSSFPDRADTNTQKVSVDEATLYSGGFYKRY